MGQINNLVDMGGTNKPFLFHLHGSILHRTILADLSCACFRWVMWGRLGIHPGIGLHTLEHFGIHWCTFVYFLNFPKLLYLWLTLVNFGFNWWTLSFFGICGHSGSTRASVQQEQGLCTEEALGNLQPSISWLMYGSCTFRAERGMSHFNAKRGMRNLNRKCRAWA